VVSSDDNVVVVVFSHRGTKTFSVRALEFASSHYRNWVAPSIAAAPDFRIETCTQENCAAFAISHYRIIFS